MVTGAILQGWMRGIRPGWVFKAIAGQAVETDEQVEDLLQRASDGSCRYEVKFERAPANFGAEAKERSEKEKQNRVRLRRMFPFQAAMDHPEQRAVTQRQLQRVVDYAERYCMDWHEVSAAKASKTCGKHLWLEAVTLYHLNTWMVLPATKPRRCSFVELLTGQPQSPSWFVSHWWGDPLLSFVQSLRAHAAVRRLSSLDTAYWIWAFASRQHQKLGDIMSDARKTGFGKALAAASFKLLLVADPQAAAFTRLWCAYEALTCLDNPASMVDVATWGLSSTEVLTDGLTEEEEHMEESSPGAGFQAKTAREASFPVQVADHALAVDLFTSQTSQPEDRAQILGVLAGCDSQAELDAEHPRLTEASRRLRAHWAALLWRRAAACPEAISTQRCAALAEAIRSDTTRRVLCLRAEGLPAGATGGVHLLASALGAPGLQRLSLGLRASSISDADLLTLAQAWPRDLRALSLDLRHCKDVGDAGLTALAKHLNFAVTNVALQLDGTAASKEIREWYIAESRKQAEHGEDGRRRDVARALGVSICRRPEQCTRNRKTVVPAVPTLARIVEVEEDARARTALRAIGSLGERALLLLGEAATQKARELQVDLLARERPAPGTPKEAQKIRDGDQIDLVV